MKYIVIFFLLFFSFNGFAQTEHLKEFYPVNSLFKKLKVKAVIDSFTIHSEDSRVTEYDTSGRKLGSYYYSCPGCFTPVQWISKGDTLTCLQYYGDSTKRKLFSREQFIYNKKGEILSYSICHNPYTSGDGVYAEVVHFFYNSTGLFCKIKYYKHDYPGDVKADMIIPDDELTLSSAIYYTYKKTKNGLVIIAKETVGSKDWRQTDTIIYNKANRLIKQNSFARMGIVGERGYNNLNKITEYQFSGLHINSKEYFTYCLAISSYIGCLSPQQDDIDRREIWLDKQGLLQAEYSYYYSGEKYLVSKYYYTFY